ncbi:unnamed protein product [Hymenolepis diminuta]|uniref:DUF569 domain-containing protein n=1 Tax=Hymenolepis diminuta TaxID=6216 RepID=A0A158QG77_HYMDI|nr:unnamed protein product [Hymenolepis diminuta]
MVSIGGLEEGRDNPWSGRFDLMDPSTGRVSHLTIWSRNLTLVLVQLKPFTHTSSLTFPSSTFWNHHRPLFNAP